ncbi:hypothetical protein Tco_1304923 [Tanacetum coccineum]
MVAAGGGPVVVLWCCCSSGGLEINGIKRVEIWKRVERLPEEMEVVCMARFHRVNLKKYLTDANLHVPLDEIKVDKTLRFVEVPLEIMDREVKTLKRSKIPLLYKVHGNSGSVWTSVYLGNVRIIGKAKFPSCLRILMSRLMVKSRDEIS